MTIVVIGLLAWSMFVGWTSPAFGGDAKASLQDALYRRFQPSRIEIGAPAKRGTVTRQGKLLILSVDGVPAKPFHVVLASPKSPASHVMDFARVGVSPDGSVQAEATPLRLDKGTRLVVLDVSLKGDRVHLLTHTADPLPGAPGREPFYGCTEFVFDLEPAVVRAGRAEVVVEWIDRWLEWTSGERVCAPGSDETCMEP